MQSLVEIMAVEAPVPTASEGRMRQQIVVREADNFMTLPNGQVRRIVTGIKKQVKLNLFFDATDEPYQLGDCIPGKIVPRVAVVPYKDSENRIQTVKSLVVFEGQSLEDAAKSAGHQLRMTAPAAAAAETPAPAVVVVEDLDE